MNQSLAIFLVNDAARAIYAIYDPETEKTNKARTMFKTFDKSIKVDDLIVVPTTNRVGMTVVKVTEVDAKPDYDSTCIVQWVVARVDRHAYEVCLSREGDMLKIVQEAEESHKREELRAKLFAHSEAQVRGLSIAKMENLDALPPPVAIDPAKV